MDWIKMRTNLYTDPKVSVMADLLHNRDGELARSVNQYCQRDMTVTRNVMRNAVVGALVSVWGVARLRGDRKGDDIVIPDATIHVLDDIADIPGFGESMAHVGWARGTDKGVVFPCFFETYNVDPKEEAAAKNRERQRRFREKNGRNGSNVTVTLKSNAREEKSREEYLKETKAKKSPTRFTPPTPQEASDYARTIDFDLDGHNFCDFYGAKGWKVGSSPMKDWKAAVRTWKHRHKGEQQEPASYLDDYPGGKNDPVAQKLKAAGIPYEHWLMKPWPIPSDIEGRLREHREAGEPRPDMWIRMYSALGWCREDVWEAT